MASGLPMQTSRPIRTRFRFGSAFITLNLACTGNSPDHSSTGTLSAVPSPCGNGIGLEQLVCIQFQVLFHSPSGVLFAFPSRYWFTIGHHLVFSLGEWSPQIQTGFHVSGPTQVLEALHFPCRIRDSHPVSSAFPCSSAKFLAIHAQALQPL